MADISIDAKINTQMVKKGADQVVNSVKRIEKATNKATSSINRRAGRSGGGNFGKRKAGGSMALLEASRAIEDYSVAGMRGALNNIPQIIQNLAPGLMGVAGAATVAFVAVDQGLKMLEKYLDKQRQIKESRISQGRSVINFDDTIKAAEKAAAKIVDTFNDVRVDINRSTEIQTTRQNVEDRIALSNRELKLERELAIMRRNGATDAEMERSAMQASYKTLLDRNNARKEEMSIRKNAIAPLEREEANSKRIVEAAERAKKRQKELRKLQTKAALDAVKIGKQENYDVAQLSEMEKEASDEFKRRHYQELKSIENEIALGMHHEQRLKNIQKEIEEKEHALKIAKDLDRAEKTALKNEILKLNVQEANLKTAEIIKNRKMADNFVGNLGVSSSGMLSSLGSRGLGAAEATDSLNIQKSMLSVLKSMDKNLRDKLFISVAA